ncbi:MAG: DUF3467 domain-containing protein [Microgenomates group bacterium]|jgi:hypothetical protein
MINAKEGKHVIVKSNTIVGTVYSQLVGVTITDIDLTLEFVYVNPRPNQEGTNEGAVVARVTLPIEAAKGLSETIKDTLTKHFAKKGN